MRRLILIELFLLFFLLPNLYGATKSAPKSNTVSAQHVPAHVLD
jgi:hypothetical protein